MARQGVLIARPDTEAFDSAKTLHMITPGTSPGWLSNHVPRQRQITGRYSKRERGVAELRLDDADVLRPHSQQLFLRTAQGLEPLIGQRVANPFRLDTYRAIDVRRFEQRDNRALQRAVERPVGIPQITIRLFDAGL